MKTSAKYFGVVVGP